MDDHEVRRGERLMATAFYTLRDSQSRLVYQVGVMPAMYEREHFFSSSMAAHFGEDVDTGVAVVNTGSEDVIVTMRLKDVSGNTIATRDVPLQAGHQMAKFISEFFLGQVPADFQGVLEITTQGEGVVTLGLLMTEHILTSIRIHHYGTWTNGHMGGGMEGGMMGSHN
jgi:hypothetical protein